MSSKKAGIERLKKLIRKLQQQRRIVKWTRPDARTRPVSWSRYEHPTNVHKEDQGKDSLDQHWIDLGGEG